MVEKKRELYFIGGGTDDLCVRQLTTCSNESGILCRTQEDHTHGYYVPYISSSILSVSFHSSFFSTVDNSYKCLSSNLNYDYFT